jgi:molecular chaperone HscB
MPCARVGVARRLRQSRQDALFMTFPDPTENYFTLLGVTVGADDTTLRTHFLERTRQFHPDRFATADEETQENALEATSLLNNIYRTLKDPFARAEYLLQIERNIKIDDLKGRPPQDIFAEILEIQEAVMEYHEARDEDNLEQQEIIKANLMTKKSLFEAKYESVKADLNLLFTRWDGETSNQNLLLDAMTEIIATRRYLQRVITNLENL